MNVTQFNISILLVVCFASQLFSDNEPSSLQTPFATTTFAKRISATGRLVDTIQTADKSYVSVSQINSKSFLVRKIASSGTRVWERILRLQVEDVAGLAAITQTTDGGYILAGYSTDCVNGGIFDCLDYPRLEHAGILIKLRPDGTVAWEREYTNRFQAGFTSLVSTADGGVIVTGFAQNHLMLARYTSNGTILWSKSFPDLAIDYVFVAGFIHHAIDPHLVQTPNNSLIVVANVSRFVNDSLEPAGAFVMKVNDSGVVLWKKSLQMRNLFVQKIAPTSHDGIVLAGSCYNNCKQLFMVRLKADGSVQTKRRYSPQVASVGPVTDIIQTSDDGFTIVGSAYDTENRSSVFVAKIDSNGNASFGRTFRIADSDGASVFPLSDGYLLFGSADNQDTIILKLDAQGLFPGCDLIGSPPISRIPFRNLRIKQRQPDVAVNLSLDTSGLAGSSKAARRRPVSNLCP